MEIPSILALFREVLERLEGNGITYMVVGSLSSIVYGEPRMTNHIDLVVDIPAAEAGKFAGLFPAERFHCPPAEILTAEIVGRGQFNLIHHETGLKIDLIVRKRSPHAVEEFARRRKVALLEGFEAYLASPEDVILKKLDFFREGGSRKHLADIRGILANTEVDDAYLKRWVKRLGLAAQWKRAIEA